MTIVCQSVPVQTWALHPEIAGCSQVRPASWGPRVLGLPEVTGTMLTGPLGEACSRDELPEGFVSVGYVSEDGLQMHRNTP